LFTGTLGMNEQEQTPSAARLKKETLDAADLHLRVVDPVSVITVQMIERDGLMRRGSSAPGGLHLGIREYLFQQVEIGLARLAVQRLSVIIHRGDLCPGYVGMDERQYAP
jgi:hypothetical protein